MLPEATGVACLCCPELLSRDLGVVLLEATVKDPGVAGLSLPQLSVGSSLFLLALPFQSQTSLQGHHN